MVGCRNDSENVLKQNRIVTYFDHRSPLYSVVKFQSAIVFFFCFAFSFRFYKVTVRREEYAFLYKENGLRYNNNIQCCPTARITTVSVPVFAVKQIAVQGNGTRFRRKTVVSVLKVEGTPIGRLQTLLYGCYILRSKK